jgi:lysozyme
MDILMEDLRSDEGVRQFPYRCSAGKLTIGVGWNLEDNGLPDDIINDLLCRSILSSVEDVAVIYPDAEDLGEVRYRVLLNMAFNLGRARLAGFKKMWLAIAIGDFDKASEEMLDSKWANDVGNRAVRLAKEMKFGETDD